MLSKAHGISEVLDEARRLVAYQQDQRAEIARTCGQTRASWRLLAVVPPDGSTVPHLAVSLKQSRQGVQRVADGLVERGLATYEPNPHHRRSPRLLLTANGVATLARLEQEAARRAPDLDQDVEPEDLETTLYVLRALREAL